MAVAKKRNIRRSAGFDKKEMEGYFMIANKDAAIAIVNKLTGSQLRLWLYLMMVDSFADLTADGEKVYHSIPSLQEIAIKIGVSPETVGKDIRKLKKLGLYEYRVTTWRGHNLSAAKAKEESERLKKKRAETKSTHGGGLNKPPERLNKHFEGLNKPPERLNKPFEGLNKPPERLNKPFEGLNKPPESPETLEKSSTSGSPQTLQTYSDFKQTLSESERENFLKFVEDKTKNLEKPINDLEAWLASKNAANQNRWEVYHEKFKIEGTDNLALQKELEAKQRAIAYFQNRHNVKNEEIKGNKLENQENRVEAQSKPIGEGRAIADFTKRNNPKNAEIEPKNPNLEQNNAEALEKAEIKLRAIAEFQKRMKINQPVPEPEEINSEEYRQKRAAFDELLSSVLGEKKESLAQQYREARAEAKRQQQELARQRREAAAKYDEQQDPELQRRREIKLREIEEFILRDSQRRNSERTSEKPENE